MPKHWAVLDAIAAAAPVVAPTLCHCDPDMDEHPAVYHCSKCGKDFCEALTVFHRRHGGTLTPVASGRGSMARVIPTMCQLKGHTDQALDMYCFTCKQPVCIKCGILTPDHGGHNGHNVQVAVDAVDVCLADLDQVRVDAQAQSRTLQQAIAELQATIAQLSAKRSAADLQIDATCNEVPEPRHLWVVWVGQNTG